MVGVGVATAGAHDMKARSVERADIAMNDTLVSGDLPLALLTTLALAELERRKRLYLGLPGRGSIERA